jgi:hypothetical protein
MEYVAILSVTEKDYLVGKLVQPDWYFNPILSGNTAPWVISQQEIDNSIYPENDWVKTLPLVEYNPIIPSGSTIN